MIKTIETIKLTSDIGIFCRERAVVLHDRARVAVPDNAVAFVVAGDEISAPLTGLCDVFGASGIDFCKVKGDGDTAAVDLVFVSTDARIFFRWHARAVKADGNVAEMSGRCEFATADAKRVYSTLVSNCADEKDIAAPVAEFVQSTIARELASETDSLLSGVSARYKSVVGVAAEREFGLRMIEFAIDRYETTGIKEVLESDDAPVAMFCSECGTRLAPQAKFCPQCGKRRN